MRELQNQIIEYLQNCGENSLFWDTTEIAVTFWERGYTTIVNIPEDEFVTVMTLNYYNYTKEEN